MKNPEVTFTTDRVVDLLSSLSPEEAVDAIGVFLAARSGLDSEEYKIQRPLMREFSELLATFIDSRAKTAQQVAALVLVSLGALKETLLQLRHELEDKR